MGTEVQRLVETAQDTCYSRALSSRAQTSSQRSAPSLPEPKSPGRLVTGLEHDVIGHQGLRNPDLEVRVNSKGKGCKGQA